MKYNKLKVLWLMLGVCWLADGILLAAKYKSSRQYMFDHARHLLPPASLQPCGAIRAIMPVFMGGIPNGKYFVCHGGFLVDDQLKFDALVRMIRTLPPSPARFYCDCCCKCGK